MAWETLIIKTVDIQDNQTHKNYWLCPMCKGKTFAISYHPNHLIQNPRKNTSDENTFRVLICDRCGQIIAFDGCKGTCACTPRSKCESCGKYYCRHCGVTDDFEIDGVVAELRYCNEHIPEWYKNR